MAGKIHLLDPIVASQIAAGEVIERPASVVKELVENALDAGATRIEVEIEEGGKRLIRVTDNGCGMSPEDAVLSLQRHATSKIRTAEDLQTLRTLGFRGEALPSIAAVSHLTLQTREPDQEAGTELRVEGGAVVAFREVGCPIGTAVTVQRLFYNVPARLKFLKATNTERNHILDSLRLFGLRYLPVAFRLTHGGQELLRLQPAAHLSERLPPLLGRDLAQEMIPVELEAEGLRISGSIGKPPLSRVNREHQMFFVNGHAVRDKLLRLALYEGYHTLLSRDRHPVAVLWIDVDPGQVDINVHPTKSEVRFSHEVEVHRLVVRAVREALEKTSLVGRRPGAPTPPAPASPAPLEAEASRPKAGSRRPMVRDYTAAPRSYRTVERAPDPGLPTTGQRSPIPDPRSPIPDPRVLSPPPFSHPPTPSPLGPQGVRPEVTDSDREAFRRVLRQHCTGPQRVLPQAGLSPFHRFLGQVLGRFFVAETDAGFVLIDQHEAHRQILRAQWQEWWDSRRVPVVRRDPPVAVEVPQKTVKLLQEERALVQALGLELEAFGKATFLVRAVPEVADHLPAQELVLAVVMALVEVSDQPEDRRPWGVMEALAQRCALPVRQALDAESQAAFVTLLQAWWPTLEAPEAALAEITLTDLEKMFQRR